MSLFVNKQFIRSNVILPDSNYLFSQKISVLQKEANLQQKENNNKLNAKI